MGKGKDKKEQSYEGKNQYHKKVGGKCSSQNISLRLGIIYILSFSLFSLFTGA